MYSCDVYAGLVLTLCVPALTEYLYVYVSFVSTGCMYHEYNR